MKFDAHVIAWRTDRAAKFADVLLKGGSLIVHPDTWAIWKDNPPEFLAAIVRSLRPRELKVFMNQYVEPTQFYAIPKPRIELPMLWGMETFELERASEWDK